MTTKFQDPFRHRADGFSLLEVILAVGLLGFGVAIVLRLLTGSMDTLKVARAAKHSLDLVPILNAKLSHPGIDDPPEVARTDVIPFQRRFFDAICREILDNGAVQLLVYQFQQNDQIQGGLENALGTNFVHLQQSGGGDLERFFSGTLDQIAVDKPLEVYRLVLSASSANSLDKLESRNPSADEANRGEVQVPEFFRYDILTGQLGNSAGNESLFVCRLRKSLDPGDLVFLAIQVHIFRQRGTAGKSEGNPSPAYWNQGFQVEDLVFSYNTSLLAY